MSVATRAMQMVHDRSPSDAIMDRLKGLHDEVEVMGAQVLTAIYVRPDRTKGGLYLADNTKDEDLYQGKVQLVLKCGPLAFVEDESHKFPVRPNPGDWVLIRVGDSFPFLLGEQHCRLIEDVQVRAIIRRPDIAL